MLWKISYHLSREVGKNTTLIGIIWSGPSISLSQRRTVASLLTLHLPPQSRRDSMLCNAPHTPPYVHIKPSHLLHSIEWDALLMPATPLPPASDRNWILVNCGIITYWWLSHEIYAFQPLHSLVGWLLISNWHILVNPIPFDLPVYDVGVGGHHMYSTITCTWHWTFCDIVAFIVAWGAPWCHTHHPPYPTFIQWCAQSTVPPLMPVHTHHAQERHWKSCRLWNHCRVISA